MIADFLVTADSVQIANDKLNMLGGAWSLVYAQEFPVNHPMGVAAGLRVGWNETNQRHTFAIVVRNEDTAEELWNAAGEFEQGRPPGIPPGLEQRVLMGFNLSIHLGGPGDYALELMVDGETLLKTPFAAVLRGGAGNHGIPR